MEITHVFPSAGLEFALDLLMNAPVAGGEEVLGDLLARASSPAGWGHVSVSVEAAVWEQALGELERAAQAHQEAPDEAETETETEAQQGLDEVLAVLRGESGQELAGGHDARALESQISEMLAQDARARGVEIEGEIADRITPAVAALVAEYLSSVEP